MDLTLNTSLDRSTLMLGLTTASQPVAGSSQANTYEAVIWATTAFTWAVGINPTALKPSAGTPGDRTMPAGIPLRVRIPAGHQIAALALTGAGDLFVNVGA
jgi:hypothetical protein